MRSVNLQDGWRFRRLPSEGDGEDARASGWTGVDLPHCPFVADLDGREHWFGECEYQRDIEWTAAETEGSCALFVGAAMNRVIVLVDGREWGRHSGGYLPFEVDLTEALRDGRSHGLTLRIDNREDPDVPPGKPYRDLDFCWYGGLYRGVELRGYPALHFSDPIAADEIAGGGVFVRTLAASAESATVALKVHVRNAGRAMRAFTLEVELSHDREKVAEAARDELQLAASAGEHFDFELPLTRPRLWQPDSPALHEAQLTLRSPEGELLDRTVVRFGVRRIQFSRSGGFTINGTRRRLRGTNRHQEYPRVGYALPKAAQRRDARRIKEAGFDYVRLSHYPQSPDFLEACDELGILMMNCIPGWQFMGGASFRDACIRNARELIRRDRNHPCVVLWELSLNETAMDDAFTDRLQAAGHEEFPGDQMFTCGWVDRYDVFIHSRQHGEIHRWQNGDKALVVAEYGDWEFYASSDGFDQTTGAGVFASWSHSRQRRLHGERGLRQQALNHLLALNDTLSSPAVLDGQWSMFDYARGYDPQRAACGVMDIFRLPKFSYYFYRSQRDAEEDGGAAWTGGPMVFIASHWRADSDPRLFVFSNCEEVELRLNGAVIGREQPARAWMTQFLPHPPFVFDLPVFHPGTLEAAGLMGGAIAATHRVETCGAPMRLELSIDSMGIAAARGESDVLIAHASQRDDRDALCVGEKGQVIFVVQGGATLVGSPAVEAEAGVASAVLNVPAECETFSLEATRQFAGRMFTAKCEWRRETNRSGSIPECAPTQLHPDNRADPVGTTRAEK